MAGWRALNDICQVLVEQAFDDPDQGEFKMKDPEGEVLHVDQDRGSQDLWIEPYILAVEIVRQEAV